MKKGLLFVFIILFTISLCSISALEITINSPINNSVFQLNTSDPGIYIPVNVSTDEDANCRVLPWGVNFSIISPNNYFNNFFITNNNLTDYEMTFICNDANTSVFEKSVYFSLNYSCFPNLVNTSWGDWENDFECTIRNLLNQTRFNIQYDSNTCGTINNSTFYEHRPNYCDYCSQNITGPFYYNWSECNDYGIRERRGYYNDLNFQTCCNITGLPDDCQINNQYRDFTETEECNMPLNLFVNKPSDYIYESRRIDFDINSSLKLEFLEFIDFFNKNKWETLCRDCQIYKTTRTFLDGKHNLTIRARTDGKEAFSSVSFIVDTKNPTLHSIGPRGNRFTNGSDFYVKYTEENCKSIILEVFGFGGIGNKNETKSDCISGRNIIEEFNPELSDFDDQEISYQFAVYDITDKKTRSKFINVKVDTTSPVINSQDGSIYDRSPNYVSLKINITEKNLDKVEYKDLNEVSTRQNWKPVCTKLKNNICEKRFRFKGETPNIRIRVLDKAGNSVETQMSAHN